MDRRRSLRSSTRSATVALRPEDAWGVVASGEQGPQWYVDAAPFVVRGALDRLVGGAGRRWPAPGRPVLRPGDQVGFWSVEEVEHRTLVLAARVRAPGEVRLVTAVRPEPGDGSRITQTVSFAPHGVLGGAYLVADLPARGVVAELVMLHLLAVLRNSERADNLHPPGSVDES